MLYDTIILWLWFARNATKQDASMWISIANFKLAQPQLK